MNKQDYLNILQIAVMEGTPHPDYDRTVSLAKTYKSIMTGKDQKEMVLSYRPRETPDQKVQRLNITIPRTDAEGNRFVMLTDKIKKIDNIVDNVYYMSDKTDRTRIDECRAKFYQGRSIDAYLHDFNQWANYYDPNAWLLINFMKVGDKNVPYPVEYKSADVYRWSETINDIDWFIALQRVERGLLKYTMFAPDWCFILTQMDDESKRKEGTETLKIGDYSYLLETFNTLSGSTPVFRAGYIRDVETDSRTFVSILHPAMNSFKRLINDGSEYDLTKAIHGFLQKYQYANVCDYTEERDNEVARCNDGYLRFSDERITCPQCKGRGLVIHTTPQDVVMIKHPDGKDEHIPLEEMVHYVTIPESIIANQKEDIDRDITDIQIAILNTQLTDDKEVQRNVTATEKVIDLDNINTVLYRHAQNHSRLFRRSLMQCATYMGVNEGLVVNHEFPKDFQLESLAQLIQQRTNALAAGVPYAVIENIDTKILTKQSQGDMDNILWVHAWELFRPWRELPLTERLTLLADLPDTNRKKVLYTYFEEIRRRVDAKFPQFYKMTDRSAQESLINAIIDVIITEYDIKDAVADDLGGI